MKVQWNGRLVGDEEIERLWKYAEMQKTQPKPRARVQYDIVAGYVILGLFVVAVWTSVYHFFPRFK